MVTDCVPSKTLIATAELMTDLSGSARARASASRTTRATPRTTVVRRPRAGQRAGQEARRPTSPPTSAAGSSARASGCVRGRRPARRAPSQVVVELDRRRHRDDSRPTPCSSPPARARACCRPPSPTASGSSPGSRSTTSPSCPTKLIVVGSGVTGAEFASAYIALGIEVVLVSSRDRVLPGEDADAATVLEDVLNRRGMEVLSEVADGVGQARRRRGHGDAHRRPHRQGLALPARARVDPEHRGPRARGGRGGARRRRLRHASTGSRAPPRAGCTPPATAPAYSCSPASPPCRAGSRCGTSSATR